MPKGRVDSKAKGKRNEVAVAEIFSKWWQKPFKRIPASGALRWKSSHWIYGDLVSPEDFNAMVECKSYNDVNTDAILQNGLSSYILYWFLGQVRNDVTRAMDELKQNIHPLLVWRKNQGKQRIVMSSSLFEACPKHTLLKYLKVYYPPYEPLVIMLLNEFCEGIPKEEFKAALSKINARNYVALLKG